MTWRACSREPEVARAVRAGGRPAGLAAHVDACPACREATVVAARLQAAARATLAATHPPDPSLVWSRAALERELARRGELARRAARPVLVFRLLGVFLSAAAAVAWALGAGPASLGRLTGTAFSDPTMLSLVLLTVIAVALVVESEAFYRLTRT